MKINNSTHKLPAPENRLFWFCALLIFKFSLLFFLISEQRPTLLPNTIAVCSGDCESYLSPIESLLLNGNYEPDFRMPGYGFPYLVFRLIADKDSAVNFLIVFQTLLDAIAALLLAIALYWITGKRMGFYITLILYGIGITVSCYNNWIMTESLTASFLVFGFYYLINYTRKKKDSLLLLSGLFFTWAYFLRPVNILILPVVLIVLLAILPKNRWLRSTFLFLLPAIILNSAWTIRNYFIKGNPYILTENLYVKSWYGEHGIAGMEFCKTFSDFKITYNFFEPNGLTYFGQAMHRLKLEDIKIPDEIYTPEFSRDSLLYIQNLYRERGSPGISPEKRTEIERTITKKFQQYTYSIKKHHPYIVYVKTPLLLTKSFISQAGVHNLFFLPYSQQPIYKKLIKLLFVSIYLLSFGLFIAGIIFYKKIFENKFMLLAYAIAFYIIFIHSIVLRSIEPRYIVSAYPFFVIAAVFTINSTVNFLKKNG